MIIGKVEKAMPEAAVYGKVITEALAYLRNTDFTVLPEGRYDLDKGIFALLQNYEAKPFEGSRAEAHVKYVDIQYIVAGEEQIGWAMMTPDSTICEDLLTEKDICFYSKVEQEVMFPLRAGMYAVFFPEDVHRPGIRLQGAQHVTKVVVKIPVSLF